MDNESTQKELISLFLDRAMNEDQQQEFISKIKTDPVLSAEVEREKQFRNMIKSSLHRPAVGSEFVQNIRKKIH